MPLKPWESRYLTGDRAYVLEYPVVPASTVLVGDIVTRNVNGEVSSVVAADPTPLLGVAQSGTGTQHVNPTVINVSHFTDNVAFAMEGSRAPLATDIGKSYGLVLSGGAWIVDLTDTVATRVMVESVDTTRRLYWVIVLAAHRQAPVGA